MTPKLAFTPEVLTAFKRTTYENREIRRIDKDEKVRRSVRGFIPHRKPAPDAVERESTKPAWKMKRAVAGMDVFIRCAAKERWYLEVMIDGTPTVTILTSGPAEAERFNKIAQRFIDHWNAEREGYKKIIYRAPHFIQELLGQYTVDKAEIEVNKKHFNS